MNSDKKLQKIKEKFLVEMPEKVYIDSDDSIFHHEIHLLENEMEDYESSRYDYDKSELESLYEKSHESLKYVYRIGWDMNSGKSVAVQFELHTGNIKKSEYIDYIRGPLKVKSIFYKDGRLLQSVRLTPLFRYESNTIIQKILLQLHKDGLIIWRNIDTESIYGTKDFQKAFVSAAKTLSEDFIEEYHISIDNNDKQGNEKYKTTKYFEKNEKRDILKAFCDNGIPKQEDREMFLDMREIMNYWDLANLISWGAPEDEYDSENDLIMALVNQSSSQDEITDVIHNVFRAMFNDWNKSRYTFDECIPVAEEIKDLFDYYNKKN